MQALSKAIFEQLSSTSSRGLSAPVSSSRDDPHPTFLTPLPQVALPYELSLLDNLFVNPMAQHNKASDYTQGNKGTPALPVMGPPQGFPPVAFGGVGVPTTLQAYGMAAIPGSNNQPQQPEDGGFDMLNFLMDEDGLGGTGNWDALEVPPDFSLWS